MKKTLLPLLLVAAPLSAQSFEAGLFIGQQSYKSFSDAGLTAEPAKKTVAGVRFGYSLVDLGPALLQVTAGYQPESKTGIEVNGTAVPGFDFTQKHWSVGAMFNFKAFVAIGAGVEYRSESLGVKGPLTDISTTYGRPWARANVGFAFPTPIVKPFIGLEVALPLTSTSPSTAEYFGPDDAVSLKAHAPKMQIGVYGGIRF
ncbi:MAG: hypothetical protein Q8K67_01730 [Geothrix sp.]|nr:hypothetical protein [Geothrix sp.]